MRTNVRVDFIHPRSGGIPHVVFKKTLLAPSIQGSLVRYREAQPKVCNGEGHPNGTTGQDQLSREGVRRDVTNTKIARNFLEARLISCCGRLFKEFKAVRTKRLDASPFEQTTASTGHLHDVYACGLVT